MTNAISKEAIIAEAAALATNEGRSANAKVEMLASMAVAAQSRSIQPNDAGDIFDSYLNAKNSATVDKTVIAGKGKVGTEVTEGYAKKTKSEWRQVISCGAHLTADGVEALNTAREVAIEVGVRVYDAVVQIARKQIKSQTTLTRDDIKSLLTAEGAEKDTSELAALKAVAKSLEKVIKGIEASEDGSNPGREAYPSTEAQTALDKINARIADITPSTDAAVAAMVRGGLTEAQARAAIGRRK